MNATTAAKAELLRSLHIAGDPLIVTNVWDAVTARIVAGSPGVKAVATASHAVSFAHGVDDGEGLTVDQALETARLVSAAVDVPVSIDFERGYSPDIAGLETNITRLIAAGAAGLNIEDSTGPDAEQLLAIETATERIAAVRRAATLAGVPLAINARVDALARGGSFDDAAARANSYLAAGADSAFVLGLATEELVARAVAEIDGPVAVIAGPGSVALRRLADLGVARVSFGPGTLGLTLAHLRAAATQLTALGEYPAELGFGY